MCRAAGHWREEAKHTPYINLDSRLWWRIVSVVLSPDMTWHLFCPNLTYPLLYKGRWGEQLTARGSSVLQLPLPKISHLDKSRAHLLTVQSFQETKTVKDDDSFNCISWRVSIPETAEKQLG